MPGGARTAFRPAHESLATREMVAEGPLTGLCLLNHKLGYTSIERHTGVNKPKMGNGGGGGVPGARPDIKKKMLAAPKPKRPLQNL